MVLTRAARPAGGSGDGGWSCRRWRRRKGAGTTWGRERDDALEKNWRAGGEIARRARRGWIAIEIKERTTKRACWKSESVVFFIFYRVNGFYKMLLELLYA